MMLGMNFTDEQRESAMRGGEGKEGKEGKAVLESLSSNPSQGSDVP
jgi:hypothetical protein